jgi:hypothetical protein
MGKLVKRYGHKRERLSSIIWRYWQKKREIDNIHKEIFGAEK